MEIRGKPDELDRVAHVIGVPICRPTDRSSHDSSLEEPGFEPLVPRDTTKFSTPAHHFCLTPCTRKSRRERQPTPRGCRAPPAEPMVRILFPPAVSLRTFGSGGELPPRDDIVLDAFLGQATVSKRQPTGGGLRVRIQFPPADSPVSRRNSPVTVEKPRFFASVAGRSSQRGRQRRA